MPPEIDAIPLEFSMIIPVYNDWEALGGCLRSLGQQTRKRGFEVVVVDDGSQIPAPESIRQFSSCFPLTIIRQPHTGIAAARNFGVQNSKGATLVFTDADCRLDVGCLSFLEETISGSPQHNYFQLRLGGDSCNLLGRAEELRLLAIQNQLLRPDGHIRYLNTSGFAIRRSAIKAGTLLFDPTVQRSEDTLLLTNLIQNGELPFFAADAVVRHTIHLSFNQCIGKDLRVAWLDAKTYERIAATGVNVRMNNRERMSMLRYIWNASRRPSIGRVAWFALVFRQALQRATSTLYRCLRFRSRTQLFADPP